MASQPPGKLSGAREIAAKERIPAPFLWKILHTMTRKKLIRSFKGVRGGYELARPAKRISLAHVIYAMENTKALRQCLLGFPECGTKRPCPLHTFEDKLKSTLQTMTLADIARLPRPPSKQKPNGIRSRKPAL